MQVVGVLGGDQPDHSQARQAQSAAKVVHMAVLDQVEVLHGVLICLHLHRDKRRAAGHALRYTHMYG